MAGPVAYWMPDIFEHTYGGTTMTEAIRRPVSQLRAGDLISLEENGEVFVVSAVSQPIGSSRLAELMDARTGLPAPWVRLGLHDAVLTHSERARWIADAHGDVLLGLEQLLPDDVEVVDSWPVEIDLLGRPGWEQLDGDEPIAAPTAA
ncbi:hypothetical protein [Aeromicrobium sp.]|uniref:hypothetical protein n=1 Tax=Aeromicrobium sp. TaxID=1871063 RepID=UPI0028B1FEE0|nr:hypothetical protein [Aeromicrobium sp.]